MFSIPDYNKGAYIKTPILMLNRLVCLNDHPSQSRVCRILQMRYKCFRYPR